jgi:hypothetical protein
MNVLKPSIRIVAQKDASVIFDPKRDKRCSIGAVATEVLLPLHDRRSVTEFLFQVEDHFETYGGDPVKDLKSLLDQLIQPQLCATVA